MCYHAKFGRSRSNDTSICVEICQKKNGLPASCLSRSLKVIRTDMDQLATYDYLLVIHSNHGHISYCYKINSNFGQKSQICHTRTFDAPADGVPLGIL